MLRFFAALALICGLLLASPASAQLLSLRPNLLTAEDERLLGELRKRMTAAKQPVEALSALDDVARDRDLTPRQRLIVATFRMPAMVSLKRADEGVAEVERAAARADGDTLSHVVLANLHFDRADFPRTARELMAALALDMEWVGAIDDYDLMLLFDRLGEADTEATDKLERALAKRLFDAGWIGGYVGLRSRLANELSRSLLEEGRVDEARTYVLRAEKPTDLYEMLTQKRFAQLHRTIEEWAGPRLEKQWPIYLAALRADFARRPDEPAVVASLAGGLAAADLNGEIVRTVLPAATRSWRETGDSPWIPLVVSGASALANLGRWDEALRTIDSAQALVDPRDDNGINFTANRARLLLAKGEFDRAVAALDALLPGARSNEAVGRGVMTNLLTMRVCARHQGAHADASAEAEALSMERSERHPRLVARMWLCLGKPDRARNTWLAAIAAEPDRRDDLLSFLQPVTSAGQRSKFERDIAEEEDLLRRDPALLAAVRDIGRVLSWQLAASVPRE